MASQVRSGTTLGAWRNDLRVVLVLIVAGSIAGLSGCARQKHVSDGTHVPSSEQHGFDCFGDLDEVDVPLEDVLRMFSKITGSEFRFNTNEVHGVLLKGKDLTIEKDVLWTEALSGILSKCGLAHRQDQQITNVYHIIKMTTHE